MVTQLAGPTAAVPPASITLTRGIQGAWPLGQVLQALVVKSDGAGNAALSIAGQGVVQARSELALTPGQVLRLRVESAGRQPVLKVLDPLPARDPVAGALRTTLPRQTPLAPALQALIASVPAQPGRTAAPGLGQAVEDLVARLRASLPDSRSLATLPGLTRAIRDSGLFLEARLATDGQGTPARGGLEGDLKAGLLRLLGAVSAGDGEVPATRRPADRPAASREPGAGERPATARGSAPELAALRSQVDGAVQRIQLNQLASLPDGRDGAQHWRLELPYRLDDEVRAAELRIERDPRENEHERHESAPWRINLRLDLGALGPLHARLLLHGDALSATFWAERPATADLVSARLDELAGSLDRCGLRVAALDCHAGAPAAPEPPLHDGPLLSVRT